MSISSFSSIETPPFIGSLQNTPQRQPEPQEQAPRIPQLPPSLHADRPQPPPEILPMPEFPFAHLSQETTPALPSRPIGRDRDASEMGSSLAGSGITDTVNRV